MAQVRMHYELGIVFIALSRQKISASSPMHLLGHLEKEIRGLLKMFPLFLVSMTNGLEYSIFLFSACSLFDGNDLVTFLNSSP